MEEIFEGKESMFGDPFSICKSEDGEYWIHKPMDEGDSIAIPFTKETALAMAQAMLKDMDYVSMPKYIFEGYIERDR